MYAKDTSIPQNIRFALTLQIDNSEPYTIDSFLHKADYYYNLLKQIPFLLEYIEAKPDRGIDIVFDNGNSLSDKVKERQSGNYHWSSVSNACLAGATEEYLSKCATIILRINGKNGGSQWIITPELDVILTYDSGPGCLPEILKQHNFKERFPCMQFNTNGELKE